jgi:HAMP domain-containing protein
MFELIKRRLSFKVSLALTLFTIPPMVVAAYFITSHEVAHLQDLAIEKGQVIAVAGARIYGETLEAEIDNGLITVGDVIDPVYEEIKGYDFGDHPRFHTKYDFYTDRAMLGFMDSFVEASSDILYAVGADMNGYIPTHNSNRSMPLVGERVKDTANYRSKRKFANPLELAAARNVQPLIVQSYARDTGEMAWDIGAPIYVKGRHFGGFRVGVSVAAVTAHKRQLVLQLATVFGFLATITIAFIFVMIRRSVKPLEQLSTLADNLSMGDGLETPINPTSVDEVGKMAKSLDRLRASLKVAMSRLGT